MGGIDRSCGCGLDRGSMTSSWGPSHFPWAVQTTCSHSWLKLGSFINQDKLMWKWVLGSRLQASDFQGDETHIHIPEWENTSPWDRAVKQLVRLSRCTMCPLRTEPGQGWGQVAGRCCHLKGWGMPEPEGRMAASKGTEQLKARGKKTNTQILKLSSSS